MRAQGAALEGPPTDGGALRNHVRADDLARTWAADAQALITQAAGAKERRAAAELLVSAAELHAAYDPDAPAKVIDLCERALLLAPGASGALDLLERSLGARGEWSRLVEVLQRLAHSLRDPAAAADVQVRLAVLDLVRFGDATLAVAALERALALDVTRTAAVQLGFELHDAAGRQREAVSVLERHLAAVPDRPQHEAWRLYAASAALSLGDEDRARSHLDLAHGQDPDSPRVAAALAPLLERSGEWDALVAALETQARATSDLARRRELLRRAAELCERELQDPAQVAERWREMLALDSGDAAAAQALEAALVRAGKVDEVARDLRRRIDATSEAAERRQLLERLARYREQAGDAAAAASTWREVLAIGEDVTALRALAAALEALGDEEAAGERCAVLARLSRSLSGGERVAVELERCSLLDAVLGRPEEAASILVRALDHGDDLQPPLLQRAAAALEPLLERGIAAAEVARALASTRARLGDAAGEMSALDALAQALPPEEREERARVHLQVAAARYERLSDVRGAFGAAAAALQACPDHQGALGTCERLAREAGFLEELYGVLDDAARELEGRPDEERMVRVRAAAIAEQELGRPADATTQLRRALQLVPGDRATMAVLTRVLLADGRWEEACDLLETRSELADGVERAALLAQLGEIRQERVGDPGRAAEAYRRAVDAAPPEGRPRLLWRLVEALAAAGDHRAEAEVLGTLARGGEAWGAAEASRRRARLLVAPGGDPLAAIEHFGAALLAGREDAEARVMLESLAASPEPAVARAATEALLRAAEAAHDARRILATLEARAARTADPAERSAAERHAARIWGDELGQWSMAFAALQRALRASAGDAALRRELRAAAARAGAEGELPRAYEAFLPALEGAEAAAAWRELGDFREEVLADAEGAARAFAEALRLVPHDREALSSLVRLHRAAGRDRERVEACLALADRATTDDERLASWREAAQVLEERLDDPAAAVEIWRKIAELSPDDDVAHDVLEQLLARLDRPAELAAALEWRRARPEGAGDVELACRLAELRSRLGAPAEALALLAPVLCADPRNAGARAAVADLVALPGPAGRDALAMGDGALRATAEHAGRVMLRERRLASVEDPLERVRLHGELRAILEHDLGQPEMAMAAAARAFSEGGVVGADAERDLARLAAATGRFEEAAEAYQRAAASADDETASVLVRRAARLRTEHGADPGPAIAAWMRVLETAPDDVEALGALERLHARAEDAASVAEVAHRRAAALPATERAAVLLHLAQVEESLGDHQRAIAAAEAAAEAAGAVDGASAEALAFLVRAHRDAGDHARLARALRAQAERAHDDVVRRHSLLLERARLLEDTGDAHEALDAYAEILAEDRLQRRALEGVERLLARDEAHDAASRMLEDVYRAQGDARRLAALLDRRLDRADPSERGPVLAEIAVLRERLGERGEAFRARARALREKVGPGDDVASLADLERLAAEAGAFDELAEAYEEALARGIAAPARDEVRRRLAGVYADRLDRPALAARTLEALAADAPDAEVLAALARVYRRQGSWQELASTLRRQAGFAPSRDARKDVLFEVASVMREQLSDREGAMEAYRQILSVDPEDPNALRLLGDALGASERWEDLVEVLGREVDVAERRPNLVGEATELRFRLGRIRQQRLADTAGALQCYRSVLERAPRHPAALAALEELARGGGAAAVEAATLLEPVYEQEHEHAKLVQTLEARAAAAPDATARAALLLRVAQVQASGLRNPEVAFLTAARAVREDPDHAETIAFAASLAEEAGLQDELAALLAEVADRLRDARARLELRRRVAHLTARGGDPRRTADAWSRVLELAPDDAGALEGLTGAHRQAGEVDALAQVLRRRSTLGEDPAGRVRLLAELAELQDERQQDHAGAIATLRRLLELEPSRRDALARLDRLCVKGEKWVELGEVLARETAAAEGAGDAAQALTFRQRLAELKETHLLDREGALALHEQVLTARPDDAQTLERVEALLQRDPANVRAAALLERAYAATGAWGRYAAVLELRAAERPDPVERKSLFLELAEVQEQRLGSAELAFIALCRAFRDDPSDPALRGDMQRLAEATGHAEELAAIYEDVFEELLPAVAAEVALTLGTLHEAQLGDPAAAIGWLERARRLDPAAAQPALAALDRLYRANGDLAALAEVLELEAGLSAGEDRAAFLFRLGQLCDEHLKDAPRAARAYQALVAEQPAHGAALRALERIHDAEGRLDALAENLAAQLALLPDGPSRLRLTVRLAHTTQALGKDEEAAALWRDTLGLDPRHELALSALEALYEKLQRWPELIELLRARVALTADRREAARLHEKLAMVLATRLGDAGEAIRAYHGVLDTDPRNRRALEALRGIHEQQGDLEALASVVRRLVPLQEDAAGVKSVRMQLADVLLRAGKKGEAAEQGRRALELEPNGEAELSRLSRIFEAAGAPQDGVRAIEARAALLATSGRAEEAVEAWSSAAAMWEQQLAKPDAAAAALEKVLELEPARRDAWSRLKDLHARAGNWRAYVHSCDLFTGHMQDRAERLATLKELGEIHEKRLGQKEMAFITLCRAFGEDPADAGLVDAITRLAGETQAWDELTAVYEQVAEDAAGTTRARLLLQLGRLRDAHLDDADGAEAAFRKALDVDPANPEALDALTELFTRRGRVRDLVIALEQKLEAAAGLDEKKATLTEMARIYEGQLHDPGEAITALKRVLELDGGDTAALETLAGIYRRESRWGDLAGVLARTRDLAQDGSVRLDCQLRVAALYENELADDEAAIEAYRGALAVDDRQRDALSGLERLYTKLDRFAELNGVYEKQVELAVDARERVRVLGKSAAIWEEKLQDPQRAIARHEAILALDPGNLTAVKGLEALYRRERQPEKLIAVLQHHAALTHEPRELVSLEVQIGEVWWKDLGRTDRAEAIFTHALQIEPEARETISALAGLHEQNGSWNLALEMLQREAKLAGAGSEAVDLQWRIARIQQEHLQDPAAARISYARALDADPGHLPSLRALRAIALAEGDREAYLRLLLAEARYTEEDQGKAELLYEAGRIHQEERDDPDGAARLYEEALRKVPDLLPAARPLADLHVVRGDWPRAEVVLDVVVARLTRDGEPQELCRQSYRLGYVAEKLGNRAKALGCYRRAYEIDATYLPALEGLGALLLQEQAWDEALRIFQSILIHHRDGLTDLEVVETYWQIGDIQVQLRQLDRAANSFQKALEIDAGHERSRRSLVAVLEASDDWEAAVEHRRKLLPLLEGSAKRDMYVAIGTLCRDRLQDSFQAADAFTAAARLDPGNADVIEALLGLYRETRQGQKAADVLSRLLESPHLKADAARAARLHHVLALTLRDELKDEAGAARELERALDADPGLVQAFADLEALLTRARKWRELAQAYVRMIQRLPKVPESAAARLALWKTLGELYRRVLDDAENARMAYEVVATADPDDATAVEAHADLASKLPGHEPEAISSYRRLLVVGASPQKPLSALIRLHAERKAYDDAYSAAQALAFLAGGASTEEGQVLSRLRRFARETATGALDDAAWEQVVHERARGPLAAILALLVREGWELFAQQPRDLGLTKKDELDVAGSMLFFANMYKYVARVLGVRLPPLFRSAGATARLQLLPLVPPALAAAEELFKERPKKELWFIIGKAMTFLRPELTLARLMPHDQLDALFQAAASVGTSRFTVSADPHLVEKLKRRIEHVLPDSTRSQTLKLLARSYCDVQQPGDVRAYMDSAELTSNRVGALLAGDLDVVRRLVLAEKAAVSKLKEEVRVRDLILFCASPGYAAAREHLGMSVVVPATSA